ncbi:DUF5018 domain-containing protein [Parapedobacter sp. SGR-10]|uniref:DUF5018 domain-containing protein n=1 Tax=Parapedobacter sp. SGR-10 TaxID=2710879 RepID=UPI0013CF870F|nr:cellulase family glycosylhydrolase [Parapedobacter sp. SGR-10]NGF56419.1 DUF5018 domain-containing protein [Parapedobacter sp. SGR-10]
MKQKTKYLLTIVVLLLTGFVSCKEDKGITNYYHRVNPVIGLTATLDGSSKEFYPTEASLKSNDILVDFPYYFPEESNDQIDVSKVKLDIEFNEEITVLSPIPDLVDLRNPFVIQIENADGKKEDVKIIADVKKSNRAQILSFSLPSVGLNGTIVESIGMIGIDRGNHDLSNVVPQITISGGATISPDPNIAQNFNNRLTYTVTAQDGTQRIYSIEDLAGINNFEISKGVNVASWLSTPKYDGAQRVAFFTEEDVELLAAQGFDHIRLCIDEVYLWDESGQKIRPYAFDLLHDAIGWCIKHNMRVLVDMHITRNHRFTNTENTLFTNPAEPAKFVKLWEDLSDELKHYPNALVAYELLNEPVSGNAANWNNVAALAINAIRAREPDRTIVVGVCTTNGSVRYAELNLPSNHQILLTYHFYGPFLLTAYGLQSTTGGRTDIPIQYPGQLVPNEWISQLPANWQSTGARHYDRDVLETSLLSGINMAKRLNAPVFVGEFGTLNTVPEPSRANWYRDVVYILDKHNVPYTSFDYKGAGYSVVNENRTLRYPHIIDILTGK